MNKKILALVDDYGISLEAPTELNNKMKEGLARMFADEGIRAYMENAVKKANQSVIEALDDSDTTTATYYANRMKTLLSLMILGKNWYMSLEKLKKLAK